MSYFSEDFEESEDFKLLDLLGGIVLDSMEDILNEASTLTREDLIKRIKKLKISLKNDLELSHCVSVFKDIDLIYKIKNIEDNRFDEIK